MNNNSTFYNGLFITNVHKRPSIRSLLFMLSILLLGSINLLLGQTAPVISYAGPQTYKQGNTITNLVPTNTGGAIPYGTVATLAGGFSYPTGVAVDTLGNVYVADLANHKIPKISPLGIVTTLAGSGIGGFANGNNTAAQFSYPYGVAVNAAGNVYVADQGNNMIRMISPAGVVTTLASGSFDVPHSVAADASGYVYVADQSKKLIFKISPNGVVSTLAGSGNYGSVDGAGTAASFYYPSGIAVDASGNVYVADTYNNMIRKVSPIGVVTTLAGSTTSGSTNGTGTAARFNNPYGVAVDASGNVYVGDFGNNMVRKITPAGQVTTLAGNGAAGFANGIGSSASFSHPYGIAVDTHGNVYVADQNNNSVRTISVMGYSISPALPAGLVLDASTGTISGTPTALSPATVYTITAANATGSGTATVNITVTTYITPGGVSGAALWVRADDGTTTVGATAKTAWTNQSATTNLAGTGTFNNNAANLANFNPVVTFDGTTNAYSASNLLANGITGNDNFLVARSTSYSIIGAAFVYGDPSSFNRINCQLTWTDGLVYWDFESNSGNGRTTSIPLPLNTYGIYGFHNDNTAVNGHFIALNGTVTGSSTVGSALTFNGATYPTFSLGNSGSANYYQGNIPEMVTFPTALTTTQRQQVESYLGVKYGESLPYNYLASNGTTITYNRSTYPNNIAGIGRDDTTALNQKQSQSINTAAKGNMVAMGLTAITTSNALNTGTFTSDRSFNIWGDDGGSVTTATALPTPGFSSCAQRLTRLWKVQKTGTGTGAVQVMVDLKNTLSLTGFAAADIQLVIDTDGDGNLATGTLTTIAATTLVGGVATFNNINWDSDGSGTDVFAIVINKANNLPVAAIVSTATAIPAYFTGCTDSNGYLQFVDNISTSTIKYMAIAPNGNTAYDFATVAPIVSNNSPVIGHQMRTDGSQNTTALANRMWTITDKGTDNYTNNGGMTVRLYYDPADLTTAAAAMDIAHVSSPVTSKWFKFEGASHTANVAAILAAQTARTITGATFLIPSATGTESNGTSYVEFTGITNFSTFGYMAAENGTVLPVTLASFIGTANGCTADLVWQTATESNSNHYEVETGTDGTTFASIAQVASKNSATGANYSYVDRNLAGGANYFRLKEIDNDGKYTYSQTLAVTATGNCATGQITAFPNPAHNVLNVEGLTKGNHIVLSDINGKQLTGLTAVGTNMAIDISSFAKGVYTLQVETSNGNVSTLKVVKE